MTHVSGTIESSMLSELQENKSKETHPKLKGVSITALKGGNVYHSVTTDVKGTFSLYLDGGEVYQLIVSKKDYYSKKFIIDCSGAPRKNSSHPCQLGADIALYNMEKGLADSAFSDVPYASAKFYGGIIKFNEKEAEISRLRYNELYEENKKK